MSRLADLATAPSPRPKASRFTMWCGLLYGASGIMLLAIVGWLYVFGGRTGARQFVAASVLDRLVLVPAVLVPLALSGLFPHLLLTFAVLDPLLGGVAWYLLARSNS